MKTKAPLSEMTMLGEYAVARLQGEIDLSNAEDLGVHLRDAVPGTVAGLILDLEGVEYVDSVGVRMLFEVVRQMEARRQLVAASVSDSAPIRALLKVAGLHKALPVHQTPEECAESLAVAQGGSMTEVE